MIEFMFLKVLMLTNKCIKKRIICYYWYKRFKFQSSVCIPCHVDFMMLIDLNSIARLNINNIDYSCIISRISKSEKKTVLRNADLSEKNKIL